jgi:hypothetical protein
MSTVTRAPEQIHESIICYDNILKDASTITASFSSAGNPGAAFNWFTFDGYQAVNNSENFIIIEFSQVRAVDYFAFYKTNAATIGSTITLQYEATPGNFSDIITVTPANESPQLVTFNAVNSDKFKIVFSAGSAPLFLGVASFGEALRIPFGLETTFNSPHNAQQYEIISNQSETGNFIGRSVRKAATPFNVSTNLLEYDWFVTNWRPFLRHIERRPFFFKWSDNFYNDETVFSWSAEKIATPVYTDNNFMSFSLDLFGLTE